MARPRKVVEKTDGDTVKVKVADAVSDGNGGFYEVGTEIEAADAEGLKAKGLVE